MLFHLSCLQASPEGLGPFVAGWAGQAVEPGVGVDTAGGLAGRGEADIGDQGALWEEQT